ncbi:RNA-directed DNA polymerase from mobile element jockey [Pitangus sulphuratus]|nr:RNA-directed DNA polymerase from mobile element jockey [Pitangus sulphuratus]
MMDQGGSQCPELEGHDCENDQFPVDPLPLQLNPYQSMGPDKAEPRILKELADVIAKPFSMIFEWSQESGEVPADWKLENIISVFKKGKEQDHGNYRPISPTSVLGKLWRRLFWGVLKNT